MPINHPLCRTRRGEHLQSISPMAIESLPSSNGSQFNQAPPCNPLNGNGASNTGYDDSLSEEEGDMHNGGSKQLELQKRHCNLSMRMPLNNQRSGWMGLLGLSPLPWVSLMVRRICVHSQPHQPTNQTGSHCLLLTLMLSLHLVPWHPYKLIAADFAGKICPPYHSKQASNSKVTRSKSRTMIEWTESWFCMPFMGLKHAWLPRTHILIQPHKHDGQQRYGLLLVTNLGTNTGWMS